MPEAVFIPKYIAKVATAFQSPPAAEQSVVGDDLRISVNQALGKFSLVYEKLRNIVDYNEEHLLRKNAIFRILRRLLVIEARSEDVGRLLIQELIRINYLPNNTLPIRRAAEVEQLLAKYTTIHGLVLHQFSGRQADKVFLWWLQLAACEVEEFLFDFRSRKSLLVAMIKTLEADVTLPTTIDAAAQAELFQVAVLRTLFRSDESLLYYALLSERYPTFFTTDPPPAVIEQLVRQWSGVKASVDAVISHPLRGKLTKIARRYAIVFAVLRDIFQEEPNKIEDVLSHPKLLEDRVQAVCAARYRSTRVRVVRTVVRSIIYLFITKMFLALLVEVPVEYLFSSQVNRLALIINVTFPPLLMFFVSLLIRFPKTKNTTAIIQETKAVVYRARTEGDTGQRRYTIRQAPTRRTVMSIIFNLIYIITYGISFGAVGYILYRLDFSVVSAIIFIFFLCIISFFATHIRLRAREWVILDSRQGLLNLLFDFFSLPIVRMGQWLSLKLSKINVFVFLMDVIVEAPLKMILEVIEEWFSFVREKKEEVY